MLQSRNEHQTMAVKSTVPSPVPDPYPTFEDLPTNKQRAAFDQLADARVQLILIVLGDLGSCTVPKCVEVFEDRAAEKLHLPLASAYTTFDRLEKIGLIWECLVDPTGSGRPRRFFSTTGAGYTAAQRFRDHFVAILKYA